MNSDSIKRPEKAPRFPVFHVPHDGTVFPPELLVSVCVPKEQFRMIHDKMRDTAISRAVPEEYRHGDMCLAFPVSRLLCDVERFIGPEEIMERYGMGFCYEKAYDGTVIKHVTEDLRRKTLEYYRQHHAEMDRIANRHSRILLFDMHSYSDEIIPPDFIRTGQVTPDLCIGMNEVFTCPELAQIVMRRFAGAGFSVAVNRPYAGCYVPNAVLSGKSSCDCVSVMLEFNKRKYCTPDGRPIPERMEQIAETIRKIVTDFSALD